MKGKRYFRGILVFTIGFVSAFIFQFIYPPPKAALADQYACIRQDLDARGMTGNIPDASFTITYKVPSCYSSSGYSVERVYMYGNEVAVRYSNPRPASVKGFSGSGPSSMGDTFRPIP